MIDGINITFNAPQNTHLKHLDIWETLVNAKTLQRVTDKYTANFRGLDLCLRERQNQDGYRFEIKGSLHKYFNSGSQNFDNFSFDKLLNSIDSLTDVFGIPANEFEVHNLEIGVNIPLDLAPFKVIKNVVTYGNKPFDLIDKKNVKTGLQCVLKQYALKIYDKGKQTKTNSNILRFEISVNKMAAIKKYGITTLADLQNPNKVFPLHALLIDTASRIIWTDSNADLNKMTEREQKQWLYYSNSRSWENMTINSRKHHNRQWGILLNKYGQKYNLQKLIFDVWQNLFQAHFTPHFYQPYKKMKAENYTPFLPLEYTVKMVHNNTPKNTPKDIKKDINVNCAKTAINKRNRNIKKCKNQTKTETRFCVSCGKEITPQRKQSRFCSARYVGHKKARQCRNKESNKRLHIKRQIKKAMTHQNFVMITYNGKDGASYTDTLHPTELFITRQWLDRITSVKILPTKRHEPPETLDGKAARDYIKTITNIQS